MRQLKLCLALLMFVLPVLKCSDLGKDGFNFYKDYLRARTGDNSPGEPLPERMLYFYRTPIQLYSGLIPKTDQGYRKRTGNAFKNHMINKEIWSVIPKKRSSKAALSLMLHNQQPFHISNNILNEEIELPTLQY